MKTVKKMDAGDICQTDKIQISENMTVPELVQAISEKSPELIYDTLKKIYNAELSPIFLEHTPERKSLMKQVWRSLLVAK